MKNSISGLGFRGLGYRVQVSARRDGFSAVPSRTELYRTRDGGCPDLAEAVPRVKNPQTLNPKP